MTRQAKVGIALIAAGLTVFGVLGIAALAQTGGGSQALDVPPGPSIDFCPTTDQIEAHLKEYGFDYKPTVPCGENGEELPPVADPSDPPNEQALFAKEKKAIATATRAPDADGDPLSIELVLADGSKTTVFVDGDPKLFKDITPAELAEVLYP